MVTLIGGVACGDGERDASSDRSPSTTSAASQWQPRYVSSSIPDTPVGDQLRWLLDAMRNLPIPTPDVEAHFSAEFLARLPADQLNAVLADVGDGSTTRFLGVTVMTPTSIDAALDPGTGAARAVVSMSVDGDGRITSLFGKPFPLEPRAVLGLDPVSLPEPTGPMPVGTDTVVATDDTRDGRRIPVQLWYPQPPSAAARRPRRSTHRRARPPTWPRPWPCLWRT